MGSPYNPLRYARSLAPGSLELGPKQPMLGALENKVTYPAFLRLPDGDLLFFYRDGVSGEGNLVLNRDRTAERRWTRVHADLHDGKGRRSAYIATAIDARGTLHLAWNWRGTPDVATNHDLCYARSVDGGATWTTTGGAPLAVPINAATAEYALHIPQGTLINSFSLAADDDGHPYLANYWCPPGSTIPQYHLVRHDGHTWHLSQITQRTTPFELKGTATRRPRSPAASSSSSAPRPAPTSTSAPAHAYIIYRDDERGGRVTLAATADPVVAWEPSADPVRWPRFRQIHLFVQAVEQRDGNDRHPVPVPSGAIGSLPPT